MNLRPISSLLTLATLLQLSVQSLNAQNKLPYPTTNKINTEDVYFGTKVQDPYRWLENDTSAATADWVKKENVVTQNYLGQIPFREQIRTRLKELWNYERIGTPFKEGKYTFFLKNNGMQNQSVLYVKAGAEEPRALINPNELSKEGTVALSSPVPCKGGQYLAYQLAKAGSDWNEIHLINVETGAPLTDVLKWVKFSSISWKGAIGFYYSHFDAPEKGKELSGKNEFGKVYFHTLGQPQEKDELIYEDKSHPSRSFSAAISDDERFIILEGTETTSGNSLLIKDLQSKTNTQFFNVVDNFENNYSVIDVVEGKLIVITDKNAPKYQVVSIDPYHPETKNWSSIIPESSNLLKSATVANHQIFANYLKDVTSQILVYSLKGEKMGSIALNGLCMVDEINGSKKDSLLYYSSVSYTEPLSVYAYNAKTQKAQVFFQPQLKFNPKDFKTEQVFYVSKDGTKIPMFITYKAGLIKDGNAPCFLYGYGGFNISNTPRFSASMMLFLEQGGIYAVANLRGGGEYGENWHKAGIKCNKQNVFDDFIAAADYLTKEKYTSHNKMAIHGRSNGGLLIGATMTQRPDLAKVALPGVGVLDMLRYHKFTIGYTWASDYGTSDDKTEFECLYKYSPLHNIKATNYPATMVLTGDHDDRVVPAHSFKYAATLQEKNKSDNPMLIRIDTNAGHGAGKPTSKSIDEQTDIWSFVFYNLGVTPKF